MDKRQGFTLVELVVVVMILGILAAVAAPKLLGTSGTATDNGLRQTISVVRDSIERYAAENGGEFPGTDASTFKTELEPYLRGQFPICPVGGGSGGGGKNADVAYGTTSTPTGTQGWRFNSTTGEFIVNSTDSDNSDPTGPYSAY
jgi:general secretion pathway protein G